MKKIDTYIIEKLHLDKNIDLYSELEELQNLLETVFIYCARYKNYSENGIFQKDIYLNNINYKEVFNFIKNHYKKEYSDEDIKRNSKIRKIVSANKKTINAWLNGYSHSIVTQNNERILISGKDLYKKYENYINKKEYFE